MPYPEEMVTPMRRELTDNGVTELTTATAVDDFLAPDGATTFVIINSVCGCAAGGARPGALLGLQSEHAPNRVGTVFAGQDTDAVQRVRELCGQVPPSSPSMALFQGRELLWFLPRHMIEGRDPQSIALDIVNAFEEHCAPSDA
ncbi:MAG TPA: BrxA/BrxB family bacilliredoxin [Planctomycetes bacterium]|jgi:putative YphP/YqiW family bacilliredoxin|nr:BrxA/BrxB family bacilliredoxin [Planctomycetota bacterium]